MRGEEDSGLTNGLSRYLTNTELDQIERTKKIYERIKSEEELKVLSENTQISLNHLHLIMQGEIVADDYILKLLEENQ